MSFPRFRKRLITTISLLLLPISFSSTGCFSSGGEDEIDPEFELGDLIADFSPPTLEELDAKVEWEDRPVLDSMKLLIEEQTEEASRADIIPASEALTLRNTTPEINEQIRTSLGRLPGVPGVDGEVDYDAVINRYSPGDAKSTNPVLASSSFEFDVSGLCGAGLFSFDRKMEPFAASESVVSWQSSKDRLYDKVVMRDDLTWSDGTPITAHDIVFSFQVIMSSKVPVPAQRSGTDKIKWIEAYDDQTLVFFHQEALATNVWNINFSIIPKHIYEDSIRRDPTLQDSDHHVKFENSPVVGGAYEIAKRARDREMVLERRESYYMHNGEQVRDKPHFKTIRYRIISDPSVALLQLKAGDIEEMSLTPSQWETQTEGDDFYDKNTKVYGEEWVSFHFCWNLESPFFEDRNVRWAMTYAFDHQELLKTLRYGRDKPCVGTYNPNSPWAPKDPPDPIVRDVEKARKLLDEAGWKINPSTGFREKKIGGDTRKFEFSVLAYNIPDAVAICELLSQNLGEIGVICNVRPLEPTVVQKKLLDNEFQCAFGGWGTGADPDTSENIWGTKQKRNYAQYSNPEVDRLFEQGRKEFDRKKREEIYGKIHMLLWEDQPYTWLYVRNGYYAFNKNLRGYVFSPRGPFHYGPGFSAIYKPQM